MAACRRRARRGHGQVPHSGSPFGLHFRRGGRGIRPGVLRHHRGVVLLLTVRMLLRSANVRDPFCQLAGAGLAIGHGRCKPSSIWAWRSVAPGKRHDAAVHLLWRFFAFRRRPDDGICARASRASDRRSESANETSLLELWGAPHDERSCSLRVEPPVIFSRLRPSQGTRATRRENRRDDRCALQELRDDDFPAR